MGPAVGSGTVFEGMQEFGNNLRGKLVERRRAFGEIFTAC